MNEQQKSHLETVPVSAVRIVERAYQRTGGRSNAIKAMCLHCTGYDRKAVKECTGLTCPLHPWRPYQVNGPAPDPEDVTAGPPADWDVDLDGPWPGADAADLQEDDEL